MEEGVTRNGGGGGPISLVHRPIAPSDAARRVSGSTFSVTGGDSAHFRRIHGFTARIRTETEKKEVAGKFVVPESAPSPTKE